ncbi:MAG: AraC family transcriptional regulator [Pseudomonadota bacterium]
MKKLDRLSALIGRFDLTVVPVPRDRANLLILQDRETGAPTRLVFAPLAAASIEPRAGEAVSFCARADWGGATNPFLDALPDLVELVIDAESELVHIARFLQIERDAMRCGAGAVLDRIGEVILIRILRSQLECGTTDVSLLGGLADDRLSRAIVAMHEDPGRKWQGGDLADVAGLSLSRFSELFRAKVGLTPAAYLRRWRMLMARQDAERGERIQTIARRYGYGSGEALSRAFKREFEASAISLRHAVPPVQDGGILYP